VDNTFGVLQSYLDITDPSFGISETWTLVPGAGPSHGTTSGFPYASASTGGLLTATAPLYYTPFPGFVGSDQVTVQIEDGLGNTATTQINIVVIPLPSLIVGAVPAVCKGATSTTLSYSALANVGPTSAIFSSNDVFTVPPDVHSINFDIQGAVGGGDNHSLAPNPGNGGRVQGTLAVTPGHTLYINIGGRGGNGSPSGAVGGANGGGNANFYFFGCGGAGGGATDLRLDGNNLSNRVVVAGGGGGNGWDSPGPAAGGDGGNLIGGSSANNVGGSHSGGGTQTSGGAHATYVGWTPGGNGALGIGGDGSTQGISGGGGGGYYGGGGGIWTGGGAGSSYTSATLVSSAVLTAGYNIGDGIASFDYVIPGTYDITWDAVATVEGFTAVSHAVLPPSPITLAVPPTANAGTYNGNIRIYNNGTTCGSNVYPFTITINPIPNVAATANQTVCNGDTTSTILFAGSVPSTTFNWTNDQPSTGLASNGAGNIPSFIGTNASPNPLTALITVTPSANGCNGPVSTFTIKVNPTPSLNTTLTPAPICDSANMSYVPGSLTLGTTFTWFRSLVPAIIEPAASGSNNPNEILFSTSPNPVNVNYLYTLAANGCVNSQTVVARVNPRPLLSTTLNAAAICNHTTFSYIPASLTPGTTFMWNRNPVAGISNGAATGANNPNEVLHNTTTDTVRVPYIYTLTANGCSYNQRVWVTVYPSPTLSSSTVASTRCDNTTFSYTATSATAGTTFSWNRPFVAGISNPSASGGATISESLINTTNHPVNVTYNFTLTAHGCSNAQSIAVTVYPKPTLTSSLTPSVCDSSLFSYLPTSGTTGTTFTWTRDTVTGITNPTGAGINNPLEYLKNTTSHTIVVTYKYTMTANGCTNVQNVQLTVNPKPMLSSTLTPPGICDSFNFIYPPTSNTAGASFTWYRPYVAGILAVAQSGNGNPNQMLINSTYVPVTVTYNFTITANGCSNKQDVKVVVNPTPRMNAPFVASVCSGSPFNYVPTSFTPGATYTWNRPTTNFITPGTNFSSPGGNGVINETLVDNVLTPQVVSYIYKLSINGCTNIGTQTLKVTVNPAPEVPGIVIAPNSNPCNHTNYQNFGASNPQAPNVSYHWSATNASIYAEGTNNQNALVNFNNPGTAVVTVNSNVNGYGCVISNSRTYQVGSSASENAQVVYYNGQFVCLKNDNNTYQWGYDNAATLDSTILIGEIDQSYTNLNPNYKDNLYWCITTKDGCWQKSYFNAPTGIDDLKSGIVDMKVFPNPTKAVINVEINSAVDGNLTIDIMNMLGQTIATQTMVSHKASVDVASLPAGTYLVDCYRDGIKLASTRFIKN